MPGFKAQCHERISEQGALLTQAKGLEQFVLVRIEDEPRHEAR